MKLSSDSKSAQDPAFSLAFSYALGQPGLAAGFRTIAEDFVVVEELGFPPAGEGEHLLLMIRKTGENTRWLVALLAAHFGVAEHDIGYCGLKDRRAVTTQWFSVHLPGKSVPAPPEGASFEVLDTGRHSRKLRRGVHRGNRFQIILRFVGDVAGEVNSRLEVIAESGVPNYFGPQRFGRERGNLHRVAEIVSRQRPRFRGARGGLYLSAARSWLFNLVLAERVKSGSWLTPGADGPLWGRGRSPVEGETSQLEAAVLEPWMHWCHALEHSGLRQERRPLALLPGDFRWQWRGNDLQLDFVLQPGQYATSLLREIALLREPQESPVGGSGADLNLREHVV